MVLRCSLSLPQSELGAGCERKKIMVEDHKIHSPEQLAIEELSSPLGSQLLEFCDVELLGTNLRNSITTSCSKSCYDENSYGTNLQMTQDREKINTVQANNVNNDSSGGMIVTTPVSSENILSITQNNDSSFSIVFDSPDEVVVDDISASIDFSTSPPFYVGPCSSSTQPEQFGFSSTQPQLALTDDIDDGTNPYQPPIQAMEAILVSTPPLPSVVNDCSSLRPSYVALNPLPSPSCGFPDPNNCGTYGMPADLNAGLVGAASGMMFGGNILLSTDELGAQDQLDLQGDGGGCLYPNSNSHVLNLGEMEALTAESEKPLDGRGRPLPLAAELSSFQDSTYKVGKLSMEERREKIQRYVRKRNERNFSKKIKYACRKTLADSRPRVRGRFARNDELGEAPRPSFRTHEEEEEDEDEVQVKEQEDMGCPDIFAHISGFNSFTWNYTIQSWI